MCRCWPDYVELNPDIVEAIAGDLTPHRMSMLPSFVSSCRHGVTLLFATDIRALTAFDEFNWALDEAMAAR